MNTPSVSFRLPLDLAREIESIQQACSPTPTKTAMFVEALQAYVKHKKSTGTALAAVEEHWDGRLGSEVPEWASERVAAAR